MLSEPDRVDIIAGTAPIETMRGVVAEQLRSISHVGARLACAGCARDLPLKLAYRCFECGAWFCSACGAEHWPDAAARRAQRAQGGAG